MGVGGHPLLPSVLSYSSTLYHFTLKLGANASRLHQRVFRHPFNKAQVVNTSRISFLQAATTVTVGLPSLSPITLSAPP